jgi:hypothetical protein
MSNSPSLVVIAAFAGALLWLGAAPAKAAEPDGSEPCRSLAPNFEPKARSAQPEAVRWLGGARLSRPVATPCPPSQRPADA